MRYGKVSFVDLAGSERLKDTKSTGDSALKETSSINRSLFTLGKVRLLLKQLIKVLKSDLSLQFFCSHCPYHAGTRGSENFLC